MNIEIEKLIAARALIEDPDHWCQGANAKDEKCEPCPTKSPEAVCWCAQGACFACDANDNPLLFAPGVLTVSGYNDSRMHQDVLDLFDYAINRLMNP